MQTGSKVSSEEGPHVKLIHYFKWCSLEKEVMISFLAALGLESPECRLSFLQHKIEAIGGSFYVRYSLLTLSSIPSFCIAGTASWKTITFPDSLPAGLRFSFCQWVRVEWYLKGESKAGTVLLGITHCSTAGNTCSVFIAEVMGEFSWPSLLSSLSIPIPVS